MFTKIFSETKASATATLQTTQEGPYTVDASIRFNYSPTWRPRHSTSSIQVSKALRQYTAGNDWSKVAGLHPPPFWCIIPPVLN